ncbi:MAG: hypothetical protein AAF380_00735, partial [Bacteroidota bacterium]
MKTTFKLLHLLSYLLLCTPNTPFASTPNPRRNLNNTGNFCYATSGIQAAKNDLESHFASEDYPYQADITETHPPELKDQKIAYQIIRKAIDYINNKPNTQHPDLHKLLTLLNKYYPDALEYQKGSHGDIERFLSSLYSFLNIKEHVNIYEDITITPPQASGKPSLEVETYFTGYQDGISIVTNQKINKNKTTNDLTYLLTYLWTDALKSASLSKTTQKTPMPLVTDPSIVPLYKHIATYLLENDLKKASGRSKEIVSHLDIDTPLNAFIATNQEVIAINSSMKTHMLKKIKKDLTNYIESVYIDPKLYNVYTSIFKDLVNQDLKTQKKQCIEKFLNHCKKQEESLLKVKELNFHVKGYSE